MKKIFLTVLLLIGLVGGIFAGITLLQDRIDIRNQAAHSCPVGEEKTVVCKFTVESSTPFTYVVTVTNNAGGVVTAAGSMNPSEPSTTISEEVVIAHSGTYKCHVSVTTKVTNSCGSIEASDEGEDVISCGPDDDPPGPPTNTPSPTPGDTGIGGQCKDCSKVDISLDYTDPGRPLPTLTPPNINETDLKIGRLKIKWTPDACEKDAAGCDDVEKVEFSAYGNANCTGPTIAPTPGDQEGRYGTSIKCEEASSETGALFRLHEANGNGCRCYEATIKFKDDPTDPDDEPLFCPDKEKEVICCATTCKAPEIIEKPNVPAPPEDPANLDGCLGDPTGNYPGDLNDPNRPKCYFDPVPQCFKPNVSAKFETHSSGPGNIDYDEDFEGTTDVIGVGDEEHRNTYENGGSYDITMKCTIGALTYSCTKRVRVACTGGGGDGGGGGGGGNPPACVLPPVTGVCIDQPTQ